MGPEPIGEILSRLFAARGWGRKQERVRLEAAWAEAAGPEYAPQTRVLAIRRNILEVEVRGNVVLQELSQFHKRRLLAKLRELLTGVKITDLKFRAGVWESQPSLTPQHPSLRGKREPD
jgi:predicted nucleic acid-binding Zn ribbon protein